MHIYICIYIYIHIHFLSVGVRSVPEDFEYDVHEDMKIEKEKELLKNKNKLKLLSDKKDMMKMIEMRDRRMNSNSSQPSLISIINNVKNDNNTVKTLKTVSSKTSKMAPLNVSIISDNTHDENDNDNVINSNYNKKLSVHTMLTSQKSILESRKANSKLITIYIKVLPEGIIRKFEITNKYSIYTLYHILQSNTKYSYANHPMIVLPFDTGLYELDSTITVQNEYQIANNSGKITLDRYGIYNNIFENNANYYRIYGENDFLVFFYFQSYVALKAENLIEHYLMTNSGYNTGNDSNNDNGNSKLEVHSIPDNIPTLEKIQNDRLQSYLRDIVSRQYKDQQKIEK
jgi:hypothetical protein